MNIYLFSNKIMLVPYISNLEIMSKYSQKIDNLLTDIDPSIKLNINIDLLDNSSIKNIYDSAIKAKNSDFNVKKIKQSELRSIHTKDEYPLSYIFFKCLYETNLLDRILSHSPDITDLHTFMNWYRENIDHVDFDLIHKIMDDLITVDNDNNNDNNNSNDTTYDELKLVYMLMFKPTDVRKILHDSIYNNKFISVDVQYAIESTDLEYFEYVINDKHTLNIFVPKGKTQPDLEKVAIIIDMMENLAKIYPTNNIPYVNLTIIFSDQKKNVYPWTNVLCCDNINSGSTYPGKYITCWRREEFYKVLIHELFHYYKFDFHNSDPYYQQLNKILKVPKINGSDMINESYTESVTILILIILRYVMQNNNMNDMNIYFIKNLKKEIAFIMFQLAKIIVIFGGIRFRDLITNKIVINQCTSFRSYFLLKLILLCNTTTLIHIINESMIISNERLIEFGNIINISWDTFLENEHNIQIIDNFIDYIKDAFEKEDERWIFRTCRMSVHDIF